MGVARWSETEDPEGLGTGLVAKRKHIYVRAVTGWFASWRVLMVIVIQAAFYGLEWLDWNGRQALLFDLVNRKFYIFGMVFWPQDFIFLTLFLSIAAFSLFFFTALAGRFWCGFACPQTIYTQMFQWIEQWVEGDRLARIKLDRKPLAQRWPRKTLKHVLWVALGVWTGIAFVGYFTPVRSLVQELPFGLGPWEAAWILIYGGAAYGFGGWMREQVCKYMCPYARFQSVMCDPDTLVVTYDLNRGEPRGARAKGADPASAGLGSCVDCGICVQVCPTGIDIRNGWQYECIGCAACIDGCNQVMDKMGYPRGLIRYMTENVVEGKTPQSDVLRRMARPRVINYGLILGFIVVLAAVMMYNRVPMRVDVIRDRAILSRETDLGMIENVYQLQIINTAEQPRHVAIKVEGDDEIKNVSLEGASSAEVPPLTTITVPAVLQIPIKGSEPGMYHVYFSIKDMAEEKVAVREKSTFIVQ